MRNMLLTLVATATLLAGGLVWTNSADARPRGWRGGYAYRGPAVGYYRPYYGGYYNNWRRPYYSRYSNYPYRYSWGGPGIYFRY